MKQLHQLTDTTKFASLIENLDLLSCLYELQEICNGMILVDLPAWFQN